MKSHPSENQDADVYVPYGSEPSEAGYEDILPVSGRGGRSAVTYVGDATTAAREIGKG